MGGAKPSRTTIRIAIHKTPFSFINQKTNKRSYLRMSDFDQENVYWENNNCTMKLWNHDIRTPKLFTTELNCDESEV